MVTPVEKRSSNKFCDFNNDKGHNTDEYMQLKKQIEELVRAGKLSHLIKKIKQGKDQPKVGKKEVPAKYNEITFPPLTTSSGTEGPLVIEEKIGGHMIHRITFYKAWMYFMIVRSLSPYNGIIGRPGIKEIQAVPSTAYGMLKFSVDGGIVTIRSTILILIECVTVTTSSKEILKEAEVRQEKFKVALHLNFSDQEVVIGGTLSAKGRTELCSLLKENLDIFAWQPSDMTRVPRSVAEHQLNIQEGYSPIRQKKRGQAPERAKAILAEHDGSWRMCVDFMDLNKACPQDCYPLPEFDWKVKSLSGYPYKCFLDAYKGYHQIQMAESNEEKTAFHTSHGVYCYTKMPFGLKNVGTTYERLVDKAFDDQVGRNIEVYVDDLVIKSHTETNMLRDIGETFCALRKINMKLNPKKYAFRAM
ncbi:reverse transcriptase domain-containing protein [Tanacetum coccineum]|uniref:Reverse transcriptase domain-containing protein n=1 Tax=Tanacetum coccineum TaxID=301880 RepID=A0ABQ5IA27_9ASTR